MESKLLEMLANGSALCERLWLKHLMTHASHEHGACNLYPEPETRSLEVNEKPGPP